MKLDAAGRARSIELESRDVESLAWSLAGAEQQIATLEAQLAEANAGLNNLAKRLCLNHAATMCGDRYQRNDGKCEICEMQAKMAAPQQGNP